MNSSARMAEELRKLLREVNAKRMGGRQRSEKYSVIKNFKE